MTQKETRTLTKEEYDSVFYAYKAYLNQLRYLSENEEIHVELRRILNEAVRNPLMLNKLYYK